MRHFAGAAADRNTTVLLIAPVLAAALAIARNDTAHDFGSGPLQYANDWHCTATPRIQGASLSDWDCGSPNVMKPIIAWD